MSFVILERRRLAPSQIALALIDELTGGPPIGRLRVALDALESGSWEATDIAATVTSRRVVTFPALERRSAPGSVLRVYRMRVEAENYLPLYPSRLAAGIELSVHPYNDDLPPPVPSSPQDLMLLPAVAYPFPSHMRVLRGRARELATGRNVAGALVRQSTRERVLTDTNGGFALPLRWSPLAGSLSVDVDHPVTGNTTTVTVVLPAALGRGLTIDIS